MILCMQSLKGSISDIGREIQRDHLMTLADSLSLSGEFHGLSSNGLKVQRRRLGLSAPFSQACFSGPATTFVAAAKERSVDGLCGSLDSICWGKEPSLGTGGHFDLIYSGNKEYFENKNSVDWDGLKPQASCCGPQGDELKKGNMIYKFLSSFPLKEPRTNGRCTPASNTGAEPPTPRHEALVGQDDKKTKADTDKITQLCLHPEFKSKIGSWANILDMHASLRKILHQYPIETTLSESDRKTLIEALYFHPRGFEKIANGFKAIKVGLSEDHVGTRCFFLIREDDSKESFSSRKCIIGAASRISPELKTLVETKLFA